MNNKRRLFIQLFFLLIVTLFVAILINNLIINLSRMGLSLNLNWLLKPAGFALAEYSLPYNSSNSYAWALFIGWINSLKVIFSSLILATIIGTIIAFFRASNNLFIEVLSSLYITLIRQTPLLLQLMFWYFVGFLGIKSDQLFNFQELFNISNKGINIAAFNISAEFAALLFGLSIFTSAYIAEVIRGGIFAVPQGQWEAFRSLGITERKGLLKIIIPQALPAIIPGLTSQYLNLAKNSTLAIAIGYSDIYAINDTVINQTGRAIECFLILLISFLLLNLLISNFMEILNKLVLNSINK